MYATNKTHPMTPQEYLEWEEQQSQKHEYQDGEVYGMAGGTIPHNDITLNIASALKSHLRGKGCKVQMADVLLGVSESGPFYYPDVMVSCDPQDHKSRRVMYNPCLIVEVLSPGTEAFDRGDKFKYYRRIKTLKEYVLVSAEKINMKYYRINERDRWELIPYSVEEVTPVEAELEVQFTSVDFCCPLSLLYEDVVFFRERL